MSGAELVRRVREKRQDLRAIVMSAYTDDLTIAAARSAGADFILTYFAREIAELVQ